MDDVATPAALPTARQGAGLTPAEAAARLAADGPNVVPDRPSHPVARFARKFWGLSAWMIELIALLSLILGKRTDLAVALSLLVVNAVLSFLQEQRASSAVAALQQRLQITARVRRDARWQTIAARELVRGDVIRLRSGDFVPADVQALDGDAQADQSTLTGEAGAVDKSAGDALYAGSIVRQGEMTAVVTATGVRTYFGRTTELVERAQPRLHVEDVIAGIVKWLFAIVSTLVSLAIVLAFAEGLRLLDILPLALVVLMSAVPVALPVMFTVSMALGSIELARRGVLVTRLSAAEDAAHMDVLCADKTGTLTRNQLSLTGTLPQPGFAAVDVVRAGAWASNDANQDPIDLAFLEAAKTWNVGAPDRVLSFVPFSAGTRRTEALVESRGSRVRVMKGAVGTVAPMAGLDAAALEPVAMDQTRQGARVLAVARAEGDGTWRFVGLAFLRDPLRQDSRQLIDELRQLGVVVKMLTGDALPVAADVARGLNLGEIMRAPDLRAASSQGDGRAAALAERSGGFAEVFPEDKFLIVRSLQAAGHVVGMTGDGVNDAPALRQAEVGIAVSTATDVAKGAASVVLTTEGLANAVDLVKSGRAIYQRVLTWIINKVSRTILKAGFVVLAFLASGQFVISALGMVLLVFLTDFVKITLATDRVRPSEAPETWNIGPLIAVAAVLGVCMLGEALALLAIGWGRFDLAHQPSQLQTFTFQTLLFFALFSLVSIRERRSFWSSRPSWVLALALVPDGTLGLLIGVFGLGELGPLPVSQTIWIVVYAGVFSLVVNDVIKIQLLRRARCVTS